MTRGEQSEIENAISMLWQADEIVVDITALLTLTYLDRLEDFARAFRRIIIARASVNELNRWIAEAEHSSPHMMVGKKEIIFIMKDDKEVRFKVVVQP
jgi:predicted nucleic acid-binding protein